MKKIRKNIVKEEYEVCDRCANTGELRRFNKFDKLGAIEYDDNKPNLEPVAVCNDCIEAILREYFKLPKQPTLICELCEKEKAEDKLTRKCSTCLEELKNEVHEGFNVLKIYDKV